MYEPYVGPGPAPQRQADSRDKSSRLLLQTMIWKSI